MDNFNTRSIGPPILQGWPAIPSEYYNSYSWQQWACAIMDKIKNLIQQINSIDTSTYATLDYVDNAIAAAKAGDAEKFAALNAQIGVIISGYIEADKALENRIKLELQYYYQQLLDMPAPTVQCPVDGRLESMQSALNHMWAYSNPWAWRAEIFDSQQITVNEFDAWHITATEFDMIGFLRDGNIVGRIRSPFTGLYSGMQQIVDSLAALHQNYITAQEFDALDISAETFDNKQITAYSFDWAGKEVLQ